MTITVTEKLCEYTRGRWIESSGVFSRWRKWRDLRRRLLRSASIGKIDVIVDDDRGDRCLSVYDMRQCGDSRSTWSGFLYMKHCIRESIVTKNSLRKRIPILGEPDLWERKCTKRFPNWWIGFCIQVYTFIEQKSLGRSRYGCVILIFASPYQTS